MVECAGLGCCGSVSDQSEQFCAASAVLHPNCVLHLSCDNQESVQHLCEHCCGLCCHEAPKPLTKKCYQGTLIGSVQHL